MLRLTLAFGLFILPVSAFSRDYCEGMFCYQKKARVSCLKPSAWDLMHKIAARIGRLEITSVCDGKHARRSYHYVGQAVDFRPMETSSRVALAVLRSMPEVGGIGTYSNGLIHVDTRGQRVSWFQFRKARTRFAGIRRPAVRHAHAHVHAHVHQRVARYARARQPVAHAPRAAFRRVAAVR
jgi:hypothetical protein